MPSPIELSNWCCFATSTIREVLQGVGRGQELTLGLAVNLGLSNQWVTMFDFHTRYSVFQQFGV